MNQTPTMPRDDFDELLTQHQELIRLANDLEYQIYRLGEQSELGPVSDCQHAAGALIGLLRIVLFRHDQQVLPVLEALTGNPAAE
ncbi:MAG: hypothetical protein JNM56_26545 [Planctomycetia bacterium]|nr:hypothetical protein [Planctomycetia bacterium]